MLGRIRGHLTFANVMASLAVFIALGAGAYAASKVPKDSVGTKQLKDGAVTPPKVDSSTIDLFKGQTGPPGPQGIQGPQGPAGTIAGVAAGGALSGTYPNPGIAGGAVNSAQIATGAVGTSKFGTIPAARVTGSSTALPINTPTTVSWDFVTYDTANLFNVAQPTRLTAPVTGTYVVTGVGDISVSNIGGPFAQGFVELDENGNSGSNHFALETFDFQSNGGFAHTATGMIHMSAGDRVEMIVSQGATTATMGPFSSLSMAWVGP